MEQIKKWIPLMIIIAIAVYVITLVGGNQLASTGSTGSRFPNGISADSTSPSVGQVRGTTLTTTGAATLGGTLTVTTSNSATSTLVVGCVQKYATSTATPIREVYSTVATSSPTYTGTNTIGLVGWQYGSCPI